MWWESTRKYLQVMTSSTPQRFKIIYFLMGPWDPEVMILMGPRTLRMGPITDVFNQWKFSDASHGRIQTTARWQAII